MPAPTVTYTYTNNTTIDPSQVNQNFTDIINALTDGTKDFSISALTAAGAANLQAAVTLGTSSANDLTINGSLASTLSIKTNNTYGIGSATIGLSGLYLGAPSSRTTRITAHQSLAGSNTLVLPDGNGNQYERLETDGSGNLSWKPTIRGSNDLHNIGISASANAGALTITLAGASATLSSINQAVMLFRNATATTGTPVERRISSDLTLTLTSGSTLGFPALTDIYVYLYAIDNAGTVTLGASAMVYDEAGVLTTIAEGGAGAADSNYPIYSAGAHTSKAIRILARLKFNLTTAGTWLAPTEITLNPFLRRKVIAVYQTNAGQTLEPGGSGEVIIYEDKVYDPFNIYNTSTGVGTAPVAGQWRIEGGLITAGATWTQANFIEVYVRKASTIMRANTQQAQETTGSNYGSSISVAAILDLAAQDTFDIFVDHNRSGGDVTLNANAYYNFIQVEQL